VVGATDRLPLDHLQANFASTTFLYCRKDNMNLAAGEDGTLVFYNSADSMLEAPDNHHKLLVHASQISSILYVGEVPTSRKSLRNASTKVFVTVGSTDQMAVVWSNCPAVKDEKLPNRLAT